MEPVLSRPHIKRTPSIRKTPAPAKALRDYNTQTLFISLLSCENVNILQLACACACCIRETNIRHQPKFAYN